MADGKPGRGSDQFPLRLPDGMREQIKEAAAKSGRSMNAEIVHRLANSLGNPRFEDFALGLGEDLDWELMVEAGKNGRSLRDEMIYRLKQSLTPEINLINELEQKASEARKKYDEIWKLFMQLSPEERRLLEERVEVAERTYPKRYTSKEIGAFVRLNPIGNRGRIILTVPGTDYSPLFGPKSDAVVEDAADAPSEQDP